MLVSTLSTSCQRQSPRIPEPTETVNAAERNSPRVHASNRHNQAEALAAILWRTSKAL